MPRAGIFLADELLQQVAIVAGNFDDLAVLIELVLVADLLDISLGVRHPGVGEGREIAVVAEYRIRGFECVQLDEKTIGTEKELQRIVLFCRAGVLRLDQRVGER